MSEQVSAGVQIAFDAVFGGLVADADWNLAPDTDETLAEQAEQILVNAGVNPCQVRAARIAGAKQR